MFFFELLIVSICVETEVHACGCRAPNSSLFFPFWKRKTWLATRAIIQSFRMEAVRYFFRLNYHYIKKSEVVEWEPWQRQPNPGGASRCDMDMGPAKGTEPKGAAPITRTTTKACATVRAFCPSCQTVTVSALSPLPPMAVACCWIGLFSWLQNSKIL